jgi:hypothetical protein
MPNVRATVWHLGKGYDNLIQPPEVAEEMPELLKVEPFCTRCFRSHTHEPSLVVAGVVGCIECYPKERPEKWVGPVKINVAPLAPHDSWPDVMTAQHTFSILGYCDEHHKEWVATLPQRHAAHIGFEGQRHDFTNCKCEGIKSIGFGDYGETFKIDFVTTDGGALIWFTGDGTKFQPQIGSYYDFRATIKRHEFYQGRPQTIISRCQEATKDD